MEELLRELTHLLEQVIM